MLDNRDELLGVLGDDPRRIGKVFARHAYGMRRWVDLFSVRVPLTEDPVAKQLLAEIVAANARHMNLVRARAIAHGVDPDAYVAPREGEQQVLGCDVAAIPGHRDRLGLHEDALGAVGKPVGIGGVEFQGQLTKRTLCGVRRTASVDSDGPVALCIKSVELNRPPLWGLYRAAVGASWANVRLDVAGARAEPSNRRSPRPPGSPLLVAVG